ncbi:MAG TPA: hypothetical protein VFH78_15710 [Candidatus Thermoplasmatota archaeon]|nr:hypothetical protein [Candidatus Thermoplasmatota archaeon]
MRRIVRWLDRFFVRRASDGAAINPATSEDIVELRDAVLASDVLRGGHEMIIVVQPNVTTITDAVSPSTAAAASADSAAPDQVAAFARDKSVGGYTAWTLRGRLVMQHTAPSAFTLAAVNGNGTPPSAADTYTQQLSAGIAGTQASPTGSSRNVAGSVLVGCDANVNPMGFQARVRIRTAADGVLVTGALATINPSVGGATQISVSVSTNVFGSYTGPLLLELLTTSASGVTAGQASLTYTRTWNITRTLNARVRDSVAGAGAYASSTSTASSSTVGTSTVAERALSLPPPFGPSSMYLEAYLSGTHSNATFTDPDNGTQSTISYVAHANTYLRLEAAIGNPFTFTPADLGFSELYVVEAVVPANAEFRFANALVDGVDTTNAKGRITGLPDGLKLDFRKMRITRAYLSQGAGAADERPLLILVAVP